jgi:uncharacterized membrane protein YbaN (DUF454 family)
LAAFFFSMSSDRMHSWMLNHRYFGKVINGYRDLSPLGSRRSSSQTIRSSARS